MHLCTENIRSRIRSPRSLPSKIHAATPPQNLAAVESLLRAKRAARSSFSWPHGLLSERNREDQHAFYLAAAFPIGTKWLGALFTYVRHSVLPRHSYDLASYLHWGSSNMQKSRFLALSHMQCPRLVSSAEWLDLEPGHLPRSTTRSGGTRPCRGGVPKCRTRRFSRF